MGSHANFEAVKPQRRWRKVYIDGREGWEQYFDEQGINVIIIRTIDGLVPKISESPYWKRVYWDRANGHHTFIREEMPTPPES